MMIVFHIACDIISLLLFSYTDRILWKSMQENRSIETLLYEPISSFATSDHKPIRGLFFLPDR